MCARFEDVSVQWGSGVHWFNPVMNRQIQELDCTQEIMCDLGVSMGNAHFTKKEYATFLAALTEQENVSIHTMALMKIKRGSSYGRYCFNTGKEIACALLLFTPMPK